jgi:uncharacterized protein
MKRTFADRPNWERVVEKRFKLTYVDDGELDGHLSIIYIDKVKEPLVIDVAEKSLCLVNDGFIWTQYFPRGSNYALTTMFDENRNIIEMYFDVCNGNNISPNGIPFYDDLYLDVVLIPSGEVILLDEDELKVALMQNEITKEQYNLAYLEANKLIEYVKINKLTLLKNSKRYLEHISDLAYY